MATRVISARSDSQAASAAQEGARALKAGKLVAFATETVYGVAAIARDADAMASLRELKNRPQRPFTVHVGSPGDAHKYIKNMPLGAGWLIRKGWPGPVTVLAPVGGRLAEDRFQKAGLYDVLVSEDYIGLRCPELPLAMAMLSAVDWPVVAPSANLAGQPSPRSAEEVLAGLEGKIDLLIDSGPTRYGKDSTIVRFDSRGEHDIVRAGVLDERSIRKLVKLRLLFVCTGNTCRSPMAEGLAKKILRERLNCKDGNELRHLAEIESAGIFGATGMPATPEAALAARAHGVDISRHRSQKLTSELIQAADMVFCMTDYHVEQVRRLSPSSAEKVFRLDESGDIPDPIGGGEEVYVATAERIERALRACLEKVTV